MKIFLTGKAGSGKSTVLAKTIELLKGKGLNVGGIITPEIREKGKRIGFYVKDVFSQKMEVFASIDFKIHPKIGKYGVDLASFEKIALPAIDFGIEKCDVVVVDEIGKMEFLSEKFREKIFSLVMLDKPLIATLHISLVKEFKKFGELIEVTEKNREKLPLELLNFIS